VTSPLVPDAAIASPHIVQLRLDNARVRVMEHLSHPGDREPIHHHLPMVVYIVSGGTLRITTPDGTVNDVEFKTGETIFRAATTHLTENIGATSLRAILVELKEA
jgi:mannose-6-phosphate isomerase-like protein (cupin superfamily)